MSILSNVEARLAEFASSVVDAAIAEGVEFVGKVAVVAEDEFEALVGKIGEAATKFVTDLFADDSLSGLEKANLATTQLVEHAVTNGIELAAQDATSLIKNAYLAVKAKIATL